MTLDSMDSINVCGVIGGLSSMNNLRDSLDLLRNLLELSPCHNTRENQSLLHGSRRSLEHYGKLLVLEGLVEAKPKADSEDIEQAWKAVCFSEDQ